MAVGGSGLYEMYRPQYIPTSWPQIPNVAVASGVVGCVWCWAPWLPLNLRRPSTLQLPSIDTVVVFLGGT